jgi:hypothetical protein
MATKPNDSAERAVADVLARSDSLSARAAFMSNLNQIAPMPRVPAHVDELIDLISTSGLTPTAAAKIMEVPGSAVTQAMNGRDAVPADRVARLRAHLLRE